jgi:hypothetical protein
LSHARAIDLERKASERSSRRGRATGGLAALALFFAASSCTAPAFGIEPRYGPVDIEGDVGFSAGSVSADNSVEDAGIDDDDGAGSVRADFRWGVPRLSITLQQSTHDGSGTLSADLSQGGTTIPAGTPVVTEFDLGLHTAYLTFDVLPGDAELGFGLGVAALDFDYETMDTAGTMTVAVDELLPVPFLAVRGGFEVWRIELEAQGGFLGVAALEEEYSFVDLDVNGRLRLLGSGEHATGWLAAGFRYTAIDVEYDVDDDEAAADVTISGPYVALRLEL